MNTICWIKSLLKIILIDIIFLFLGVFSKNARMTYIKKYVECANTLQIITGD